MDKEEIGIYGVEVRGKLSELQKLQGDERVRLVDVKWSEKAEKYKNTGYSVKLIVFPVPPVFR